MMIIFGNGLARSHASMDVQAEHATPAQVMDKSALRLAHRQLSAVVGHALQTESAECLRVTAIQVAQLTHG